MKTKNLVNHNKLAASLAASRAEAGFSIVEATVGMGVLGMSAVALFSGFTSGLFTMQMARENLRATQIMLEKTETMRLYSWDQINEAGFIPPTFTAPYDPNSTNGGTGIVYQGRLTISPCPLASSFNDDMRMLTVSLNWRTGSLDRSRTFTTYIARNGLQNYIY